MSVPPQHAENLPRSGHKGIRPSVRGQVNFLNRLVRERRVTGRGLPRQVPSERSVRLLPHSAQAPLNPSFTLDEPVALGYLYDTQIHPLNCMMTHVITCLEVHQLNFSLSHHLLSSFKRFCSFLVMRHLTEVCSFSRELMLLQVAQALSCSLQSSIRFFSDPLPATPWAYLAVRFPFRENYGLTKFRINNIIG